MSEQEKHIYRVSKHPRYRAPGVQSGVDILAKCISCPAEFDITDLSDEPFDSGLFGWCPGRTTVGAFSNPDYGMTP